MRIVSKRGALPSPLGTRQKGAKEIVVNIGTKN